MSDWAFTGIHTPGLDWVTAHDGIKGYVIVTDVSGLTLHASNQWENDLPDPPYTTDVIATPSPPIAVVLDSCYEAPSSPTDAKIFVVGDSRIMSNANPVSNPTVWVDQGYPATSHVVSSIAALLSSQQVLNVIARADGIWHKPTATGSWTQTMLPATGFGSATLKYQHCIGVYNLTTLYAFDPAVGLFKSTDGGLTWSSIWSHVSSGDGTIEVVTNKQFLYMFDGTTIWAYDTVNNIVSDTAPPVTPIAMRLDKLGHPWLITAADAFGVQHLWKAQTINPWTWLEGLDFAASGLTGNCTAFDVSGDGFVYVVDPTTGLMRGASGTRTGGSNAAILLSASITPTTLKPGQPFTGSVTLTNPAAWGADLTPINIVSASWSAGVATYTLASSCAGRLMPFNQHVLFAGVSRSGYNGTFTLLSIDDQLTVKVAMATDPGGSGSGGTLTPPGDQRVFIYAADDRGWMSPDVDVPLYVDVPGGQSTVSFSGSVRAGASAQSIVFHFDGTPEAGQDVPGPNNNIAVQIDLETLASGSYTDPVGDTFVGGLYDDGSNVPPDDYRTRGITAGGLVVPIDPAGLRPGDIGYDAAHAFITASSMGYSNVFRQIGDWHQNLRNDFAGYEINPQVILIDGASPGQTLLEWADPPGVNPDGDGVTDYTAWQDPTLWKATHSADYPPITGVTATWSSGVATFTCPSRHSLAAGTKNVGVASMSRPGYNGSWTVLAAPTPFTFTVTMSNPGGSGTGGVYTPPWFTQTTGEFSAMNWDRVIHLYTLSGRTLDMVQVLMIGMAQKGIVQIMKNNDSRFPAPPNAAGGTGFREGSVLDHQLWWLPGMRKIRAYAQSIFPNLQQIFYIPREYGGWRSTTEVDSLGDAEPYSRHYGILARTWIKDSIDDDALTWTGWGPKLWWADGTQRRPDRLFWPIEWSLDGTHARFNVATSLALQKFFSESEYTPWFLLVP